MARGYINAPIPPGLARELRELCELQGSGDLGFRNMTEVILMATRQWLLEYRRTMHTCRTKPQGQQPERKAPHA